MDKDIWRDRLIDTLLDEELGGQDFVDMTPSILDKWSEEDESHVGAQSQYTVDQNEHQFGVLMKIGQRWKWAAAIAAIMAIGFGLTLLFSKAEFQAYPEAEIAGGLKIVSVDIHTDLKREQVLRTENQSGTLTLGGYAEVEVAANSKIRWQGAPDAEVVELLEGSVMSRVDRKRQGTFEVITPHGRVQTIGTVFEVRLVEEGNAKMHVKQMIVRVIFGSVLVTGSFGEKVVEAGTEERFGDNFLQQTESNNHEDSTPQVAKQVVNDDNADASENENHHPNKSTYKALKRLGSTNFNGDGWIKDLNYLAVSADGKLMATAGSENAIYIWDIETGDRIKKLNAPRFFRELHFSPDGKYLAGDMSYSSLVVYRVSDWNLVAEIKRKGLNDNIQGFAFSPNSKQIATATYGGYLQILDIENNEVIQRIKGYRKSEPLPNGRGALTSILSSVAYNSKGDRLVLTCLDKHLRIYNTKTWELTKTIKREQHRLAHAEFYEADKKLIWSELSTGVMDNASSVYSYDFETEQVKTMVEDLVPNIMKMTISHDESQLAMIDLAGNLKVIDLNSKEILYEDNDDLIVTLKNKIGIGKSFIKGLSLTYSPDGNRLYASAEFTVIPRVIDTKTWKEIYPYNQHIWKITSLKFNQDRSQLISQDVSGLKNTWDLKTGKITKQINTRAGMTYIHYSKDKKFSVKVNEAARNASATLIDNTTNKPLFTYSYTGQFIELEFSADNKHLLLRSHPSPMIQHLYLFDTETGQTVLNEVFTGEFRYHFGPAGQWFAYAGKYEFNTPYVFLCVIDLNQQGERILAKHVTAHQSTHLKLSADGFTLAYQANGTRGMILWDLVTGNEIGKIDGFDEWGYPRSVTFDPISGQIAIGNVEKIWIYDLFSRKKLYFYEKTDGGIMTSAFSQDGQRLATAHQSGSILIWKTGRTSSALTESETIEKLWNDAVDSSNMAQAYLSIGKLIDQGDQTVEFIKVKMKPMPNLEIGKILAEIATGIGSNEVEVRNEAKNKLKAIGPDAWPEVKKLYDNADSLELRVALGDWMKTSEATAIGTHLVSEKRAVQLLENIRSKKAIALLKEWAKMELDTPVKQLAQQSLNRIKLIQADQ